MRTLKVLTLATIVAILFAAGSISAQMATRPLYVVQPDDTLWQLSGKYLNDPLKWGQVLGANPFLNQSGRVFKLPDGRTVVIIKPGEKLTGLERIGIVYEPFLASELAVISITVPPAKAVTSASTPAMAKAGTEDTQSIGKRIDAYLVDKVSDPVFWVWVVIVLLAALAFYTQRWRFKNPATSGEPIVSGGIQSNQPEAIERRFQRIAERRMGEINPTADRASEIPERIGEIEEGTLSGTGEVFYRDTGWQRREFVREPAYRARFRFPNGAEEELFFLQRCANDVRYYNNRYRGFTFQPKTVVVPAPEPTPPAAPFPIAPVEAPVMVTVSAGGIEMTVPVGSTARLEPNGHIIVNIPMAAEITVCPAQANNQTAKTAS